MGKGKKKFIDKKADSFQEFSVLHRSLRDGAYANFEKPSDFVLVPKGEAVSQAPSNVSDVMKESKDHITSLGFANDGYDYEQHLRIAGGGTFIGKDGKRGYVDFDTEGLSLPDDVLPSSNELERDFQAITIDPNFMDEDIRAALFDDAEEFEELDDDFVTQIKEEPETPDFDFDAHIAKLMAMSEKATNLESKVAARGWGQNDLQKGKFLGAFDGDIEIEGIEEETDEDDDSGVFSDSESFDDYGYGDGEEESKEASKARRRGREAEVSEEDKRFDDLLEEYADERLGDLYEVEEEEDGLEGEIELDGKNEMFENFLDEYLQEQIDNKYIDGYAPTMRLTKDEMLDKLHGPETEIDVRKAYQEQMASQEETSEDLPDDLRNAFANGKKFNEIMQTITKKDESVLSSQEYLTEERPVEEWDCESVLSTYSTLDNHPTLIKDPKSKFRPYVSKYDRKQASEAGDDGSVMSGSTFASGRSSRSHISAAHSLSMHSTAGMSVTRDGKFNLKGDRAKSGSAATLLAGVQHMSLHGSQTTGKIELGGKHMLPKGFGPGANKGPGAIDEGDEEESSDNEEEVSVTSSMYSLLQRQKGESAEERKQRKLLAKELQRDKRAVKRLVKNAFKEEGKTARRNAGKSQTTDHISMFKYSA
jgi:protein LTV1